jgi:hypothetical protein
VSSCESTIDSTFSSNALAVEEVHALSLTDPQISETFAAAFFETDPMGNLRSSLGAGPWLAFGRVRNGQTLRPGVISETCPSAQPAATDTNLRSTIRIVDQRLRFEQLLLILKDYKTLRAEDQRLVIDTILTARKHALPMSTFDLLRAVSRVGSAAVWILGACESLDERSAVLNLQREFPFLWCVTSVNDWVDSFAHRVAMVAAKLTVIGIDPGEAMRMTANALSEIADLAPSLAAHVRGTFLALAGMKTSGKQPTLDPRLVARLCKGTHVWSGHDGFRLAAGDLVRRTIDGISPPYRLDLCQLLKEWQGPWKEFNESFADLIAAPHVAALCAAGRLIHDPGIVRRCREAWLFDPEYFESVAPAALESLRFKPKSGDPNPKGKR